jgi:hypothetical protein
MRTQQAAMVNAANPNKVPRDIEFSPRPNSNGHKYRISNMRDARINAPSSELELLREIPDFGGFGGVNLNFLCA